MDKNNSSKTPIFIMFALISIFTFYLMIHCANYADVLSEKGQTQEGIGNIIAILLGGFEHLEKKPFEIYYSKSVNVYICWATIILAMIFVSVYNDRVTLFGKEFGSARWANKKEERQFADKDEKQNIILSKEIRMSLKPNVSKRNLNVLVVGGSGSGKTYFFLTPNIMQLNCSFVITDPKGTTFKALSKMLEAAGYEILLFNLIEKEYSGCYNFFEYIHKESDILKIATLLVKNTNPPDQKNAGGDPFWDNSMIIWLEAIISHIWMDMKKEFHNMETVMMFLAKSSASEEDETAKTEVDEEFEILEKEKGSEYFPCKQYNLYKKAAGKTAKSILMTVGARLSAFNLKEVRALTRTDTLHLNTLGDKKKALFIVIPDTDTSMNFLVSMLYSQMFDELFFQADFGEMRFEDGQVYYHSRKSLIDKREKIENTFTSMLGAQTDAKKDKLYRNIFSQMDKIYEEFGVKPHKPQYLTEAAMNEYLDSIDDLSRRMVDRKAQLKNYYAELMQINKELSTLKRMKAKADTQKQNREASSEAGDRMKYLLRLRKELKGRIKYEFGIPDLYEGQPGAEKKYMKDISLVVEELQRNTNLYGSENTLRERTERAGIIKERIRTCQEDLHDLGWWRRRKRSTHPDKLKLEKRIANLENKLKILELVTYYEFGIKDFSSRMNSGKLPVHVRCMLDEFANITPIPEFQKMLAVMRSRNVSATIILQNMAQLKEMYKDSWENITGNCDSFVFLGGMEQQTLEYVSKRLGKLTLDKFSTGRSRGSMSSDSTNWDKTGRELKTADEIGRMPNEQSIVFIRGMYPYYTPKYNPEKHKMYSRMCQDVDNENAKNFYPYKKIFIAEKAAGHLSRNMEKEENQRLIKKELQRLINMKDHAVDACTMSAEQLEMWNKAEKIENTGSNIGTMLVKAAEKSLHEQVPDVYACMMSASQLLELDDAG